MDNEPFRFYKARDFHNHEFVDPSVLIKDSEKIASIPMQQNSMQN